MRKACLLVACDLMETLPPTYITIAPQAFTDTGGVTMGSLIDYGLAGRTALVTGGNSGIGYEITARLAELGCTVVIHYLEPTAENPINLDPSQGHTVTGAETAIALLEELQKKGLKARTVSCDLTKPDEIRDLFDDIGSTQILVNNAAYCRAPDNVGEFQHEIASKTFAMNAVGTATISAEFTSRFVAENGKDGRIINISTDASQSFAYQIAYGASTAAVEAFTRSMAIEIGPYGITVNAVAPGPVQTGYISQEDEAYLLGHIPLRRIGTTVDIANTVAFLASEQASWITGQVIRVSGGHEI